MEPKRVGPIRLILGCALAAVGAYSISSAWKDDPPQSDTRKPVPQQSGERSPANEQNMASDHTTEEYKRALQRCGARQLKVTEDPDYEAYQLVSSSTWTDKTILVVRVERTEKACEYLVIPYSGDHAVKTGNLSEQDFLTISKAFSVAGFFQLPANGRFGKDGGFIWLEAVRNGKYHRLYRWSSASHYKDVSECISVMQALSSQ